MTPAVSVIHRKMILGITKKDGWGDADVARFSQSESVTVTALNGAALMNGQTEDEKRAPSTEKAAFP